MLNMDKVRNKLSSFSKSSGNKTDVKVSTEQQEKIKKYIWRPEPGKQVVRIVPYQYQPDFPFIELKFHYDFNGDKKSYLSPSSVNKPDPIVELANRLEKAKDTWLKGRKMQPKLRTYVPILVRGKESEGVKFWGFGVQVCEQLMSAINEPDYGDITDLNNGYDITVDFKTALEVKKDFPETKILIKPKPRPVIEQDHPKVKEIMDLVTKHQPNIFDIYKPSTYEELAAALELKLSNEQRGESVSSAPRGAERTVSDDDNGSVVLPTEEQITTGTATVTVAEVNSETNAASPSAEKAKKVNVHDFNEAFKNIFPDKK